MIYKTYKYRSLSQSASNYDDSFNKFIKKSEFPVGVIPYLHQDIINNLEYFRNELPADCYFTPSPLVEAHIRPNGNGSAHDTEQGMCVSIGSDIFIPAKYWWVVWTQATKYFNGVGLYLDFNLKGENVPMFHFDLKERKAVWVHSKDKGYVYDPIGIANILIRAKNKWE